MTLLDLAARCEAAPENNPELFEDAVRLSFVKPPRDQIWAGKDGVSEWSPQYTAFIAKQHRFYGLLEAEAYLDAAMTLVPEEWTAWQLRSRRRKTRFVASVSRLSNDIEDEFDEEQIDAHASTPALAMCAAALRARAAQ